MMLNTYLKLSNATFAGLLSIRRTTWVTNPASSEPFQHNSSTSSPGSPMPSPQSRHPNPTPTFLTPLQQRINNSMSSTDISARFRVQDVMMITVTGPDKNELQEQRARWSRFSLYDLAAIRTYVTTQSDNIWRREEQRVQTSGLTDRSLCLGWGTLVGTKSRPRYGTQSYRQEENFPFGKVLRYRIPRLKTIFDPQRFVKAINWNSLRSAVMVPLDVISGFLAPFGSVPFQKRKD